MKLLQISQAAFFLALASLFPNSAQADDAQPRPMLLGVANNLPDELRPGAQVPDGVIALLGSVTHESIALRGRLVPDETFGGLELVASGSILGIGVESGIRYDRIPGSETDGQALTAMLGIQLHPLAWFSRPLNRWFDPHVRTGVFGGANHGSTGFGVGSGGYVAAGADVRLFGLGGIPNRSNPTALYLTTNYEYIFNQALENSDAGGGLTLGLSLAKRW